MSEDYIKKQKELIEETKWIDDIINKDLCCVICGYDENPLILEKHHIAGKNNSDITITVCPTCHRILTNKQKSWHKDWINKNNSIKKKLAFKHKGFADIHSLISFKLIKEYI